MPDHELDMQSEAFRGATAADLTTDAQLAVLGHSGYLLNTTGDPILTVEDYERRNWDKGREGPKSLEEAKAALAARVEDPSAPDRDASAYDDLEQT